jgi:CRP/FNR family transcriptional regulator
MNDPTSYPAGDDSELVLAALPFLNDADHRLRDALLSEARAIDVPRGSFICFEGNYCAHLPLLLSGSVRVYKSGAQGREITLFRIEPGDSCILTASCILSRNPFPAFAVTETDVRVLAIPTPSFLRWFNEHEAWRTYTFSLLARRLATVIEVVEEVAFHRMDARLASYLAQEATPAEPSIELSRTHEAIAADLGTSREVVSRILKSFELDGLLSLSRGKIQLLAPQELRKRAHSP